MIVPIGDAPNPRGSPVVTYLLIAANVAVYLLVTVPLSLTPADPLAPATQEYLRVVSEALRGRVSLAELSQNLTAYDVFVFLHGFRPAAPSAVDLFGSLFLHAGLLHLVGNMLFLWIYGDNVEHRLGAPRFLLAYLGTGVAASLFHAAFSPGGELPAIGASGAISGVLGLYFVWFPKNQVRLLWLLPPFLMDVFLVPARLVLGIYLVLDNLLPFLLTREATGIAHGAHIGGFVAGVAVAWLVDRREMIASPREYPRDVQPHDAAAVREAIAERRFPDAAATYFALPPAATHRLLAAPEAFALADWLRSAGHADAALIVLRRHMRDHPRGPELAEAHLRAGAVLLNDLHEPTSAYQHFRAALDLEPSPELAAVARRGLEAIAALQKYRIGHPHMRGAR